MFRENLAPGEYYHIFNRGVGKQIIFHETSDYSRFLFLVLYFQSALKIEHVGRMVEGFSNSLGQQLGQHPVLAKLANDVVKGRNVELVSFCLMPNHFHLVLKEVEERGISTYMQRILNAYGKYYNTKYQKSGHVFQGPYRSVLVQDDRHIQHLSAYIHRNPREISKWFNKEDLYRWSSYQDFIKENRWGELLVPDVVLGKFKDKKSYHRFVETSPAKMAEWEIG